MGAIASGGVRVVNTEVVQGLHIPGQLIDVVAAREQTELQRREREYRDGRSAPEVRGRIAILVDDGLATGSTMRAAIAALRRQGVDRIVAAVPVASRRACADVGEEADEIVCLLLPAAFDAVGEWYEEFSQTTDSEVRELLARAEWEHAGH